MAIKIYIDQGHNPYGFNAGAEGFGLREQDITYLVGAYLYDLLSANANFEALTSRKTPDDSLGYNNYSSLKQRVDEAKEWGAGYFLSIHVNANENPAVGIIEDVTIFDVYVESPAVGVASTLLTATPPTASVAAKLHAVILINTLRFILPSNIVS